VRITLSFETQKVDKETLLILKKQKLCEEVERFGVSRTILLVLCAFALGLQQSMRIADSFALRYSKANLPRLSSASFHDFICV